MTAATDETALIERRYSLLLLDGDAPVDGLERDVGTTAANLATERMAADLAELHRLVDVDAAVDRIGVDPGAGAFGQSNVRAAIHGIELHLLDTVERSELGAETAVDGVQPRVGGEPGGGDAAVDGVKVDGAAHAGDVDG